MPSRCSSPSGSERAQRYPVAALAADLDAAFHHDAVARVERDDRVVHLQSGDELVYDRLVLAVGAFPYPAYEHGVCFKRAHDAEAFDGGRRRPVQRPCRAHRDRRSAGLHVDPAGLRAGAHGRGPGHAGQS